MKLNPPVRGKSGPDGSFIEIKNIGNKSLSLYGSSISGLRYVFPSVTIGPNQFFVIARYYEDFQKVYGFYPNDTFTGRLGRGTTQKNDPLNDAGLKLGDEFTIVDSVGNKVFNLKYKCELPWTELPNGHGYTLVADASAYETILSTSKGHSRLYRYSTNLNGSPFADDPTPDWNARQLNVNITYVSFENNWIQFSNPSNEDIDISGWALYQNPMVLYEFPDGTILHTKSTIKLVVKGMKRSLRQILYKLDKTLNVFTGDYVDYSSDSNELALDR